jgi:hypothetical protein
VHLVEQCIQEVAGVLLIVLRIVLPQESFKNQLSVDHPLCKLAFGICLVCAFEVTGYLHQSEKKAIWVNSGLEFSIAHNCHHHVEKGRARE